MLEFRYLSLQQTGSKRAGVFILRALWGASGEGRLSPSEYGHSRALPPDFFLEISRSDRDFGAS